MDKELKKVMQNMNNFANGIDMSCVTAKDMKLVLTVLENSIPKEKVKEKIEEYTDYLTKGEDCTYCNNTCKNYARCILLREMKKELLEE